MKNSYTVEEIIKFTQIINCMSFDRFKDMYKHIFGQAYDDYVMEKFNLANSGFNRWICSLDYETLEAFMNYCLDK